MRLTVFLDIIVLRPLSSFLSHEVTFYVQTCLPSEEMPQQPLRKDNIDGLIQGSESSLPLTTELEADAKSVQASLTTFKPIFRQRSLLLQERRKNSVFDQISSKARAAKRGPHVPSVICELYERRCSGPTLTLIDFLSPSDLTAFEWPKTNSITDLASISENPTLSTPVQNASLLAPHLCYGCLVSLSERSKAPKETRQDVPLPEWMNDYLLAGDD